MARGGEECMDEKQFAVATLFAAILLTVVVVPMSTQQSGMYDPWLDYNEDGVIDVNELHPLGEAYGSSGDPTKNVTIAKHASKVIRAAVGVSVPSSTYWFSNPIAIDGYSKVTVLMRFNAEANAYYLITSDDIPGSAWWFVDTAVNFPGNLVKTYEAMNQRIEVQAWNGDGEARILDVDIYLIA
jgi:hypothetical protein